MPPIVRGKLGERHVRQRNDLRRDMLCAVRRKRMTDRAMRGAKAEPRIAFGHGLDAIQSDIAVTGIRKHEFRQSQSITLTAELWRNNIETDESELGVVGRNRAARDPAMPAATFFTSGAAMRQGPHHSAQKSTSTGIGEPNTSTNSSGSASIGSATGGSVRLAGTAAHSSEVGGSHAGSCGHTTRRHESQWFLCRGHRRSISRTGWLRDAKARSAPRPDRPATDAP